MNAIYPRRNLPPAQPLDAAMRALYRIAHFCRSGARIGMTGPEVATYVEAVARCATSTVEASEAQAATSNDQVKGIETMNADITAMQNIAAELQARGMTDLSGKVAALACTLDRSLTLVRDFAISECIDVCNQAANGFGPAELHSRFFEGRVIQAKLCGQAMHALLEEPEA